MSQVVIENPIINSPFDETARHFRFSDEAITDEIIDGRKLVAGRISALYLHRKEISKFAQGIARAPKQ